MTTTRNGDENCDENFQESFGLSSASSHLATCTGFSSSWVCALIRQRKDRWDTGESPKINRTRKREREKGAMRWWNTPSLVQNRSSFFFLWHVPSPDSLTFFYFLQLYPFFYRESLIIPFHSSTTLPLLLSIFFFLTLFSAHWSLLFEQNPRSCSTFQDCHRTCSCGKKKN